MLHLPLDTNEREALMDTLVDSAQIKFEVGIHDQDEQRVSSFDLHDGESQLMSGGVTVDSTQTPHRTLDMELVDPRHRLAFEPDSPAHGAVWSGYFLSVKYDIWVPPVGSWPGPSTYPDPHYYPSDGAVPTDGFHAECPVFMGPLTAFTQAGDSITVQAASKEKRAMAPHLATFGYTLKKNTRIDDAIMEVLGRIGEKKFNLPRLPWKLDEDRVVSPETEPWSVVEGGETDSASKPVSGLIERTGKHPHHIYYDPHGDLRAKRLNKESVYTFDTGNILTPTTFEWNEDTFHNTIVVTGAKQKGKGHKRARAVVTLPQDNPLSPESLGRNGKKDYRPRFVNVPSLKTDRDCRQRGHHLLMHELLASVSISFDAPAVPMLEEWDQVVVDTDELHFKFPLKQFTLPLTSDQPMTIGDTKRVKRKKHGGHDDHHPQPRHSFRRQHPRWARKHPRGGH